MKMTNELREQFGPIARELLDTMMIRHTELADEILDPLIAILADNQQKSQPLVSDQMIRELEESSAAAIKAMHRCAASHIAGAIVIEDKSPIAGKAPYEQRINKLEAENRDLKQAREALREYLTTVAYADFSLDQALTLLGCEDGTLAWRPLSGINGPS